MKRSKKRKGHEGQPSHHAQSKKHIVIITEKEILTMDYLKMWMELKRQLLIKPENDDWGTKYDKQIELLHMMDAIEVSQVLGEEQESNEQSAGVAEPLSDEEPVMTVGLMGKE